MTVGSQMPELDWGGALFGYKMTKIGVHIFSFVANNKENVVLSYIFLAVSFLFNSDLL